MDVGRMIVSFMRKLENEAVNSFESPSEPEPAEETPSPEPQPQVRESRTAIDHLDQHREFIRNVRQGLEVGNDSSRFRRPRQNEQRSARRDPIRVDDTLFEILDHFRTCRLFRGFTISENASRNRRRPLRVECSCNQTWDIESSDYSKAFLESLKRHFIEEFGEEVRSGENERTENIVRNGSGVSSLDV